MHREYEQKQRGGSVRARVRIRGRRRDRGLKSRGRSGKKGKKKIIERKVTKTG